MSRNSLIIPVLSVIAALGCSRTQGKFDRAAIKAEIERLVKIQEDAYGDHSPEAKKRIKETCMDSLIYIGGDSGGMVASSDFYVNDRADGYTEKPHDKQFQIYENMVIVTSIRQTYKLLSGDTLLLNSRATQVFTRAGDTWKMAYVTYAPLPIIYSPVVKVDDTVLSQYQGDYKIDASTTETITARDGKLISTIGNDSSELLPLNDSTFIGPGYFGKAVYVKNKSGKVTHYYFEWIDGQRITFPKVK